MCPNCKGYSERISIRQPHEYLHLVNQIESLVNQKLFSITQASCALSELKPDSVWPSDVIEHQLSCNGCGQKFSLSVETYHGAGGEWHAI